MSLDATRRVLLVVCPVLNFLVKRQPARRHRNAVKPNLETAGREIPVQPGNEGGCRIERIDVITARRRGRCWLWCSCWLVRGACLRGR
jgi:hypothetical protein